MSAVLVVGATGFLGSRIVDRLQAEGLHVRSSGRAFQPEIPLPDYRPADLVQDPNLKPLVDGVRAVVFAAGLAHQFQQRAGDEQAFQDVNVTAVQRLALAAATAGVEHFVLLSSVSVYGRQTPGARSESDPCHPVGPYAISKLEGERQLLQVSAQTGMRVTILRPATVYGEADRGNVARLMQAIDRGRFVWIGGGSNRKSLIYRDDVAQACALVLARKSAVNEIYNVSAPAHSMREIVEGLGTALGRRLPRWGIPASLVLRLTQATAWLFRGRGRLGNLHATAQKWVADDVYDFQKFQDACRFQPQVKLTEGLSREVSWYRGQRAA